MSRGWVAPSVTSSIVVRRGKVRTFDMLKIPGGPEAIERGAASTIDLTDAVIEAL